MPFTTSPTPSTAPRATSPMASPAREAPRATLPSGWGEVAEGAVGLVASGVEVTAGASALEQAARAAVSDRARAIRIFSGIANNINQAVRLGNAQGELYFSDIDKLQGNLNEIKSLFGEVLETWRLQRS